MTYRSLKNFVNTNTQEHNKKIFDLIPFDIKSKIIFIVGDGASNTAAYLSSIMSACEISHFRYTSNADIDFNKRFLLNNEPISLDSLCDAAESILKLNNRTLSNDDLFLSIALSFNNCEYIIIEMSEDHYTSIKSKISPFALVFASNNAELIENAPIGTKEIIALTEKDDFDYISNKYNQNGARITLASSNKITFSDASLLGTNFFHYDYLYRVTAIDQNNISLAHLAIEAANAIFKAPRPYIYKGLEKAKIPHDLVLYSLSPTILLCENDNFKLHHKLKFKIFTQDSEFEIPKDNTIFCGDKKYIESIKTKLKNR